MLSEAVNFCGASRHGCRADHEQAAAGNDPLDSPGTVPALSMQSWLVWANFYMIMVCVRIMPFHLPFSMSLKGQIDNNFSSGLRRVTVLSSKQCQERRGKNLDFLISEAGQIFSETLPAPDQFGNIESST